MRRLGLIFSLFFVCILLSTALVSTTAAQGTSETAYTVRSGDTLLRIAAQFHVTVTAIAQRNGIQNVNLIFIGQQLIIPVPGSTPPTPTQTSTTAPGVTPTAPPGGTITYVVRPGDTLGAIASRFHTTVSAIAQLNGIVNPNLIRVGQVLLISGTPPPVPTPTGTRTTPPSTTFELGGHALSFAYPQLMHDAHMTWAKIQIRWS
ncbi:MAG: LysM peptidoglycan-binding domain-containing protein, partial [Chloroflexota bacterium]